MAARTAPTPATIPALKPHIILPAHQWHEDPPLVMPSEDWSDDQLLSHAHALIGSVSYRTRRNKEESWIIGRTLAILHDRPECKNRWQSEVLTAFGLNRTTAANLIRISKEIPFNELHLYPHQTALFKAVGALAAPATPAINNVDGTKPESKSSPASTKTKTNHNPSPQAPEPEAQEVDGPGAIALYFAVGGVRPAEILDLLEKAKALIVDRAGWHVDALLWLGDGGDWHDAQKRLGKLLEKIQSAHAKVKVEARFLYPGDLAAIGS